MNGNAPKTTAATNGTNGVACQQVVTKKGSPAIVVRIDFSGQCLRFLTCFILLPTRFPMTSKAIHSNRFG